MKRVWLLIATNAAVAGCVSTPEVVSMGKDSYMIMEVGANKQTAVVGQANKYCAALGKVIVVRRMDTKSDRKFQSTSLIFSCVLETDPEYRRPNLKQDPTTVIEDQRM